MSTVIAVLLTAAMWFWSSGTHHLWLLAWLAPVPLLVVVARLRWWQAALSTYIASLISALNFVLAYPSFPRGVLISGILGIALQGTTVVLLWRRIARRTGAVMTVLAYPALTVAMELVSSLTGPHGTFGSLGYSQSDVLPIIQLASLIGVMGVSFLVALVGASLAEAWRRRTDLRARNLALAIGVFPLLAALIFGLVRLRQSPASRDVKIGLLANDTRVGLWRTTDSVKALKLIRNYTDRAGALAAKGAEIVVLPEKFVGVTGEYDSSARAILSDASRQYHVTLLAGLNSLQDKSSRNLALVYGPAGEVRAEYDKRHPVPGFEDDVVLGKGPGLIPELGDTIGVAICKDMDFVSLGREYANAGAGLMLVPAWDFGTDGWIHSRMAVVRGVEGGFAVARSAADGLLTLSDPYGRIVAEASSDDSLASVLGTLRMGGGGTLFSRTGEWFAWACLVGSGLLLVIALARGARTSVSTQI